MIKDKNFFTFIFFLIIYTLFAIFNLNSRSGWLYDNLIAIFLLTSIFYLDRWLRIGKFGFLMFNIALLIHNLGTFGFYSWNFGIISYDNIVHIIASIVSAWIIFNFIAIKFHERNKKFIRETVVDKHKILLIFIIITLSISLGTFVEIVEYFGSVYLGSGEGILFSGIGDFEKPGDTSSQYADTMNDIFVNTIGAIIGVLLYYHIEYRKRLWLKS